jgi:LysM repeat protein
MKKINTLTLFIAIVISINTSAQHKNIKGYIADNEIDTLTIDPDMEFESEDILDPSLIMTRDTSLSFPCNYLYKYWANTRVNPYQYDLSNLRDTTHISMKGFYTPISGHINSDFGFRRHRYHYGVDINLNTGDTIRACFNGMVRITSYDRHGYGYFIVIRHYNKLETVYGHLSKILVAPNQEVKAGDIIGLGGSTGRSTGPHLHFEFRYMGIQINPNDMIDFASFKPKAETFVLSKTTFSYIAEAKKVKYHKVRSGETLSHIAHRYGVSVSYLCRLNHLKKNKVIRPGMRIRYS